MKLGIVGLPNVGKSTLFNAITNAGAEVANYAFCTINPNVGMVSVPDARLDYLAEMYQPKKKTPAVIEFVDIAGLVKGASKGEGLGNKFLSNIRATDAIVHVVRCFDDENVMHVEGSTDPLRDIEIIDLELIMADIEMVQRRIDKAAKAGKSGDKACLHEADVFRGLLEHLNDGKSARTYDCSDEDRALLETSDLLSIKPVIYAANLDENTFAAGYEDCRYYQQVRDLAASQGAQVLPICAKVEQEIGELEPDERAMFLEELGIEESGLDRLIQCSYSLLGLEDKLKNMPNNLSGGQQQRVAIARALITKPAIVLADEPTGNLDSKTSAEVLGLIKRTSAEFRQTVVMITHNNDIARLADRIVRIEDGKIVE